MAIHQSLRCRSGQHLPLELGTVVNVSACRHCKAEMARLPGGSWRAIPQPVEL